MTIGELAKTARVNLQTIRYYERKGLLPEPYIRKRMSGPLGNSAFPDIEEGINAGPPLAAHGEKIH